MYVLRVAIPVLILWKPLYKPLKKKWFWMPILVTFVITLDLVFTGKTYFKLFSFCKGNLNSKFKPRIVNQPVKICNLVSFLPINILLPRVGFCIGNILILLLLTLEKNIFSLNIITRMKNTFVFLFLKPKRIEQSLNNHFSNVPNMVILLQ